uniref:Uncharacterized protein n=1 Tax=Theileria annulata TaxID=5874 RepID=A0A3B0MS47_THEAN
MKYLLLVIFYLSLSWTLCYFEINLHNLEFNSNIRVRKHLGYTLDTTIITSIGRDKINRILDNCIVVWTGAGSEGVVEIFLREKNGNHLMMEIYSVNQDDVRKDYHFVFTRRCWLRTSFIQYQNLLRDLRLYSRPINEALGVVEDDYDAYSEFDRLFSKFITYFIYNSIFTGSLHTVERDDESEEEAAITRVCCSAFSWLA